MGILTVGSGQQYSSIAAAVAASQDGDVLQVKAGTYTNDFATISHKITIEGIGGQVNLVATAQPPNGKAILVVNNDLTLDNISFSGTTVRDGNGAGIRYQAGNLVINNCYFHNNQDGLLAADNATGTITINNSEFAYNGTGDGKTHNLYVGKIANLTINNSYFHDAKVGHEIKSRAATTVIQNSRIYDGTSTASYSIDLPNGGNAIISNNVIQQGVNSQNPAIIHFGGEGTPYAGSTLQISNNVIINDLHSHVPHAVLNQTSYVPTFTGNQVYGLTAAQLGSGPLSASGTTYLPSEPALDKSAPWTPVVAGSASVGGISGGTVTAGNGQTQLLPPGGSGSGQGAHQGAGSGGAPTVSYQDMLPAAPQNGGGAVPPTQGGVGAAYAALALDPATYMPVLPSVQAGGSGAG